MVGNIFVSFLLQIGFTLGIIVLGGFLISLCNKRFYANFGNYGRAVCYVTGAVGTPIHECAHALFCIVFFHRITEIKLFQINDEDGTLGYVNHSYNPRNIYQRVGNFFIGVAPIIVISALLYLLARWLLPGFAAGIGGAFDINNITEDVGGVFLSLLSVLGSFFAGAISWQWWVYLVIGMFLALHMNLSKQDIKGATSGAVMLIVIVLIVDVIFGLISSSLLNGFTQIVLRMASYLMCFLTLSLIISVLAVAVSFLFRLIKRR